MGSTATEPPCCTATGAQKGQTSKERLTNYDKWKIILITYLQRKCKRVRMYTTCMHLKTDVHSVG